jgi:hypothetical protein
LGQPVDYSRELDASLAFTILGPNHGWAYVVGTEDEFLVTAPGTVDAGGNYEVAGGVLETLDKKPFVPIYSGASDNFGHILFQTRVGEALLAPAANSQVTSLYDLWVRGPGSPSLHLVGVDSEGNAIDPYCPVTLGTEIGKGSKFNAVADQGREIFFTASVAGSKSTAECYAQRNPALYVRMAGEKTVLISTPIAADCAAAALAAPCHSASPERTDFEGANEAGSLVYFTTHRPLTTEDRDNGNDLYLARIGCPGGEGENCAPVAREVTSLAQVSHDPHADRPAEVQGVVKISPDGSRAYFVALGALTDVPNAEGHAPIDGADNLYLYDVASGRQPIFIADLCSGPEESGDVRDVACPFNLKRGEHGTNDSDLWLSRLPEAQTADEEGRFLVFSTYGQLREGDADATKDVYRYDAATGLLSRISVGEAGYDSNGNSEFDVNITKLTGGSTVYSLYGMDSRAITEDGARIVFTTAEPLSPNAVNGLINTYEWHETQNGEGEVSLISTGRSTVPVSDVVISPDGRDIFFITAEALVAQDVDGAPDVYDARFGGGFAPSGAAVEQCAGDACQGPLMAPAPMLVPGSMQQQAGEGFALHKAMVVKRRVSRSHIKSRRRRRRGTARHLRCKKRTMCVVGSRRKERR